MNKYIYWVLGVVLVLVLLYLATLSNNNSYNSNQLTNATSTSTKSKTTVTTPKPTGWTSILPQTGNYQCDYEQVTPTVRSTDTVYLSAGRMRGEFRTMTAQGTLATLMIYDAPYLYTWTEGKTTGTRSQPKSISDLPSIIPKDLITAKVLGEGLNNASWMCHAWIRDLKLLTPPSYVTFR